MACAASALGWLLLVSAATLTSAHVQGSSGASDNRPAASGRRPAVLFATPSSASSGAPPWAQWVELPYMLGLHNRSAPDGGFEVDFTETLNDIKPSRLLQYNALVLFVEPGALLQLQEISKEDVPYDGGSETHDTTLLRSLFGGNSFT